MAILFMDQGQAPKEVETWLAALRRVLPEQAIRRWPDGIGAVEDITIAVVGQAAQRELARFPRLEAVLSIWAGVDRLMGDGMIPSHVPLGRLVDKSLRDDMAQHVQHWVLNFHRGYFRYREFQQTCSWQPLPYLETGDRRIGIMGLGQLGGGIASSLAVMGFAVAGWDEREKDIPGVTFFSGRSGLPKFLARTDILVVLLPLTPETENIVDAASLALMPHGCFIISCARGGHVADYDLLAALDSGHVEAAALDVFRTEPLPEHHPFWSHPRIFLTPHVSAATNPRTAAEEIAIDVHRIEQGLAPRHLVDKTRGF